MVVGAIHARQSDKRFEVAVAVVDEHNVLGYTLLPAPAGEHDAAALEELRMRAHELLRAHRAEVIVVWSPDPPPRGGIKLKPALATGRAEGAALAAAGGIATVLRTEFVSGPTVRAAGGGNVDQAVDALCSKIGDVPDEQPVRRAVAAAQAWRVRGI